MPLKPPLSANDHIVGNAKAAIQVVEYGDYQLKRGAIFEGHEARYLGGRLGCAWSK